MIKKQLTAALFLIFSISFLNAQTPCTSGFADIYPCNDYDLMSLFDKVALSSSNGSDIWGWTDTVTNKEYAITTFGDKTCFLDITDPINPVYVGFLNSNITNVTQVWRDVKVYSSHAFIVADNVGAHGMQIFDLTRLRNVTNPPQNFNQDALLTTGLNGDIIGSCHNIAINEDVGVAYLLGCNLANGGPIMVNISDPKNPIVVGDYSADGYTHDAQIVTYSGPDTDYTGKEVLVASNGNQGGSNKIVVLDVTDPENPQKISEATYANTRYTHQGWFTSNQKYFLVNDELDEQQVGNNTRTLIFDFTDLDNPIFHSQFLNTTASIDHNLYVKDDLVYQANYSSGLRILDISDINNITEVGYFDTYPENDTASFNGIWSVYPYFSSGNLILSDYNRGFFVVRKSGTLSTQEVSLEGAFSIYPNPAKNNPIVKSSQNYRLNTIELYTLLGQKVFSLKNINTQQYVLPTENFAKGIYILKINSKITRKLILK